MLSDRGQQIPLAVNLHISFAPEDLSAFEHTAHPFAFDSVACTKNIRRIFRYVNIILVVSTFNLSFKQTYLLDDSYLVELTTYSKEKSGTMSDRIIDLSTTNLKAAVKIMMAESGVDSLADVARSLNVKETTFRSAINNGSIRLNDFLKVSGILGYTVIVQSSSK